MGIGTVPRPVEDNLILLDNMTGLQVYNKVTAFSYLQERFLFVLCVLLLSLTKNTDTMLFVYLEFTPV